MTLNFSVQLAQNESELDLIRDACCEFSAYLNYSSIESDIDPYEEHFSYLISQEVITVSL